MNKDRLLSFVLALALLVLLFKLNVATPPPAESGGGDPAETVFANIHNRKSVRSYTERRVSDELLEKLVRAGMAAPSAMNRQPWKFVVVTERQLLDELAAGLPYAKMLAQAQAAIVVCGDLEKAPSEAGLAEYWVQDCAAATENILLGVEALGLGAVWTGVFPRSERIATVKTVLQLGATLTPLNVIAIGYPAGDTPPKDKWKPENLLWNRQ